MIDTPRRHHSGLAGLVLGAAAIAAGIVVAHAEGNDADASMLTTALNVLVLAGALTLLIFLATYPGD